MRKWALQVLGTFVARRAKTGNNPPFSTYTGYFAIAQKSGKLEQSQEIDASKAGRFLPLLVDPVTKPPLTFESHQVHNIEGDLYEFTKGILDLCPRQGLLQLAGRPWAKR